jgi:hypothetical protein
MAPGRSTAVLVRNKGRVCQPNGTPLREINATVEVGARL